MRKKAAIGAAVVGVGVLAIVLSTVARRAGAHCDTKSGPVAVAARTALESGEFGTIAIWVGEEQEQELRAAFRQCRQVRRHGGEARELADRYFQETAVRLHRAAEGMPYAGLKPAQPLPDDIAAAEKALQTGDVDVVADLLASEVRQQTEKWFRRAMEARKHRNEGVEAGRQWVDAYVKYVIYVHGLHQKINAGPAHGIGAGGQRPQAARRTPGRHS